MHCNAALQHIITFLIIHFRRELLEAASGCKAMESLDVPKLYNGMGKSPYVRCPLKQFPGALVLNPERLRGSKPSLKKFPGVPMVGRSGLRGGFPFGGGGTMDARLRFCYPCKADSTCLFLQ